MKIEIEISTVDTTILILTYNSFLFRSKPEIKVTPPARELDETKVPHIVDSIKEVKQFLK
jgi:hypothetical protein